MRLYPELGQLRKDDYLADREVDVHRARYPAAQYGNKYTVAVWRYRRQRRAELSTYTRIWLCDIAAAYR